MPPVWCELKLCRQVISIVTCLLFPHLGLACPPGALTIENMGLSVIPSTEYDSFSGEDLRQTTTLSIQNTATIACEAISLRFNDTITPNQLVSNNGDILDLEVVAEGNNRALINDPIGLNIGTIAAQTTVSVPIEIIIRAATSATAPGDYTNNNIKLIVVDAESVELERTQTLFIQVQVATILNINLGSAEYVTGTLAPYAMNFGKLQPGATQAVNVTTRANVQHSLRLESEHRGVMVGPLPATNYRVNYMASFDGVNLNLDQPSVLLSLGEKTALSGETRVLRATITDVGTARAGNYRDVITLTVVSEP